jgi:hypothetical protein
MTKPQGTFHLIKRVAQLEAALKKAGVPVPPWEDQDRSRACRENYVANRPNRVLAAQLGVSLSRATQISNKWLMSLSYEERAELEREAGRPDRAGRILAAIADPSLRWGLGLPKRGRA